MIAEKAGRIEGADSVMTINDEVAILWQGSEAQGKFAHRDMGSSAEIAEITLLNLPDIQK
jgi:hypothetical protein